MPPRARARQRPQAAARAAASAAAPRSRAHLSEFWERAPSSFSPILESGDTRAEAAAAETMDLYSLQHTFRHDQHVAERGEGSFTLEVCGTDVRLEQDQRLLLQKSVTGSKVWDSCVVLAKFLERHRNALSIEGRRTVELGSGCGLLGIAAGLLGADVILTDQENILGLLRKNVESNGLASQCAVKELQWGSEDVELFVLAEEAAGEGGACEAGGGHPEVVLAADVVYHPAVSEELLRTLGALCGEDTVVLLAQELRVHETHEHFLQEALRTFDIWRADRSAMHEKFNQPGCCIYLLRRRAGPAEPEEDDN